MMNPSDFENLSCEANREGHLGDVLQVFVHDFTLRQGAGEAKVREVERKIGGVTSELFILRKLLQDFQTRVNDDHDIIMRLQHEIEALQSRVRSLDSKQASADTYTGQLNLRIEQLREQISENCEDTQQNVSRLLSSFARVHLTRGSARNDSSCNNNRDFRQDPFPTNDRNCSARWAPTQDVNSSCHNETMINAINSRPYQNSVAPPETTFPHAATTDVSNEECCLNDSCDASTGGKPFTMQLHPLCDGFTSGEKGCVHETSEPISINSDLADNDCQTLQEACNSSPIVNDCFLSNEVISGETKSYDESPSIYSAQNETLMDDDNHGVISEDTESVNRSPVGTDTQEECTQENEVNDSLKEGTVSHDTFHDGEFFTPETLSVTPKISSDDEHKENPELSSEVAQETGDLLDTTSLQASQLSNELSSIETSEEIPAYLSSEVSPVTGECSSDVMPTENIDSTTEKLPINELDCSVASSTVDGAAASQTAVRKNKPKRHRGRKRKDSQTIENQTVSDPANRQTASQCNSNITSAENEKTEECPTVRTEDPGQETADDKTDECFTVRTEDPGQETADDKTDECLTARTEDPGQDTADDKINECPTARIGEVCGQDTAELHSQESWSEQCLENDITYNLGQEDSLYQNNNSDTEQPSLQDSEEMTEDDNAKLPGKTPKDQLQPTSNEFKPRQCYAQDNEGESSFMLSDDQGTQDVENVPEENYQLDTSKYTQTENLHRKEQEIDLCKSVRSFNLKAESASPQTRRRGPFHTDVDDDEIPDLSDIDTLTEEERDVIKRKASSPEERRAIEIKTPSGEITNLQTKRKPKAAERRMETKDEEQKDEVVGMCANCNDLAKLRCGNCRQAFYCKKECQKTHWKTGHKDQCRPYQVMESPELGRYMVASRDLKAGDVILKEDPVVVGPKQITEPVCLGCYRRVDGSYRCQKCHWPLCGPACEKSPDHLPECVVGAEIGSPIEISNFDEPNHFYEIVFPLRCLALKKKSPKKYEQVLALDSHYEDRKGSHVYAENQKSIVNMLRNYFFLQQFPIEDIDSSEKSIHNMTGIIDVNALEIRLPESEILGLYPNFAMMEHSCTPNTKHAFLDNRQVVLKAAVDIKSGEHLSTMYTHILWGTLARRDHLKHSKYFMCTCFRCSDPTELGTNFSTLRCKSCANGFMLSAAPLDELADWICTSCNATIKSEEVTDINLKLGEEVERVLVAPTVPLLEELLQNHAKTTVHPNHFHLFATRHTLLQMYGRDLAYANEEYMKKKERMCQDFLKVCTALDPGMSRLAPYAGVALYEYHLAVLSRTRHDQDARQTDPTALKKDVETAKALLQQCIKVLQEESKDQPEGQLCQVAQQNLIELRQWEANLFSS